MKFCIETRQSDKVCEMRWDPRRTHLANTHVANVFCNSLSIRRRNRFNFISLMQPSQNLFGTSIKHFVYLKMTICSLHGTSYKVITEDEDQIEISFPSKWDPSHRDISRPLNVDKRCSTSETLILFVEFNKILLPIKKIK